MIAPGHRVVGFERDALGAIGLRLAAIELRTTVSEDYRCAEQVLRRQFELELFRDFLGNAEIDDSACRSRSR